MGSRWLFFFGAAAIGIAFACGSDIAEGPGGDGGSSSGDPPDPFGEAGASSSSGDGCVTSLSGKVYLPEGTIPLYNAIVYVPTEPLAPFAPGVACDRCGTLQSGKPIATALTDATGSFALRGVPVGADVPVVIQIGRWRRKITVPAANVVACQDRPIAASETRLPRTQAEGDIPLMAVGTADADALECFLRRIGIADSEFTNPDGNGRVHLYRVDGASIDMNTPPSSALWGTAAAAGQLTRYDAVFMSCEGGEVNANKPAEARTRLKQYLDQGGRVFVSHYAYTWFKNNPDPAVRDTAGWTTTSTDLGTQSVSVDTSFPKGVAFNTWLNATMATTPPGSSTLDINALRRSMFRAPAVAAPAERSRPWLLHNNTDAGAIEPRIYSFNAPIGQPPEQQCGRGVFTDVHIIATNPNVSVPFPQSCPAAAATLSAQELALVFLMMDMSACIQDDAKPPVPPPPIIK